MSKIKITIGKKATETPDFLDKIKSLPNCDDRKTMTEKDILDFGENLKINGIIQPLRLWDRGRKGIYCISGNQQIKLLNAMIAQGADIPKIAVEWLDIESEEQAYQLYLAYDSTYGRYNPEFNQANLPLDVEYIQIMRLSQPMKSIKKPANRTPKEYPFVMGDVVKLGELELVLAGPDYNQTGRMLVDSLSMAEKYLKKYVDDCKFKQRIPRIKINNQDMKIQ